MHRFMHAGPSITPAKAAAKGPRTVRRPALPGVGRDRAGRGEHGARRPHGLPRPVPQRRPRIEAPVRRREDDPHRRPRPTAARHRHARPRGQGVPARRPMGGALVLPVQGHPHGHGQGAAGRGDARGRAPPVGSPVQGRVGRSAGRQAVVPNPGAPEPDGGAAVRPGTRHHPLLHEPAGRPDQPDDARPAARRADAVPLAAFRRMEPAARTRAGGTAGEARHEGHDAQQRPGRPVGERQHGHAPERGSDRSRGDHPPRPAKGGGSVLGHRDRPPRMGDRQTRPRRTRQGRKGRGQGRRQEKRRGWKARPPPGIPGRRLLPAAPVQTRVGGHHPQKPGQDVPPRADRTRPPPPCSPPARRTWRSAGSPGSTD